MFGAFSLGSWSSLGLCLCASSTTAAVAAAASAFNGFAVSCCILLRLAGFSINGRGISRRSRCRLGGHGVLRGLLGLDDPVAAGAPVAVAGARRPLGRLRCLFLLGRSGTVLDGAVAGGRRRVFLDGSCCCCCLGSVRYCRTALVVGDCSHQVALAHAGAHGNA